jgi:hypothetical protein
MYKVKDKEVYLRLVKQGNNDVNTYLEVDKDDNPIIKKREWHHHPQEQKRIFIGFDKLELIK